MVFFVFWWTSSFLTIYEIFPLAENQIALIAISGLIIGLFLVLLTKNILLFRFYTIRYGLLIPIYLLCSVVAFASMMGFPLGNLILGGIAGLYIGRKMKYVEMNPKIYCKKASLFTSIISGFWVLVIFLLALNDGEILLLFERNFGLTESIIIGPIFVVLIILAILIFGLLQFYLTRFACRLSFKI